MNKKLYLENGYIDYEYLDAFELVFNILTGPRGTGKTYGALLLEFIKKHKKFIFLRRTQSEIDTLFTEDLSPFKKLNEDFGLNLQPFQHTKNSKSICNARLNKKGVLEPHGKPVGFAMALSTISKIRGFNSDDIESIIFDEFIKEEHIHTFKGEATAFFQAYETINRNRELEGKPPVKCWLLSNSNELTTPIFIELQLVNRIFMMQKKKEDLFLDRNRRLLVALIMHSPISERKAETALYQLTKDTSFYKMAIQNDFGFKTNSVIASLYLKEFKPSVIWGELVFYEHKQKPLVYCCSYTTSKNIPKFGITKIEKIRFRKFFNWVWIAYLHNKIVFETEMLEILLCHYWTSQFY